MLLPFRLISASFKQLSRNITNDIIMKQNLFDAMKFLSNSEFQKIPMKKATAETSWEIIVLTSSIPLNSCCILYKCHQGMLDAANRLFPSMLLRNRGKHQHKDQLKDCEKTQNI